MIVDDPALARAYLDEFERVYAQAQTPTRCRYLWIKEGRILHRIRPFGTVIAARLATKLGVDQISPPGQ